MAGQRSGVAPAAENDTAGSAVSCNAGLATGLAPGAAFAVSVGPRCSLMLSVDTILDGNGDRRFARDSTRRYPWPVLDVNHMSRTSHVAHVSRRVGLTCLERIDL
jgi:hypothetical protein